MRGNRKEPVIFLAHAREDKAAVLKLHQRLKSRGFQPWLDEIDLVGGQIWEHEIRKVIQGADLVLACLSSQSVDRVGYAQNEFNMALTEYRKRPRESIFLIPVRLDDCDVPDLKDLDNGVGLRSIHWVDLFEENGFNNLLRAIETKLGDKTISTGAGSRYWHYLSALAVTLVVGMGFAIWQSSNAILGDKEDTRNEDTFPTIVTPKVPSVAETTNGNSKSVETSGIEGKTLAGRLEVPLASLKPEAGPTVSMEPEIKKALDREPTRVPDLVPAVELPTDMLPTPLFVAPKPGDVFQDCDDCPEMVVLPDGSFFMGSQRHNRNERPKHRVSIEAFALGKYEVTFAEWDNCVAAKGCDHRPGDEGWGRDRRPVVNVSWEATQQYIRWLSQKTGAAYRLPSESEWEYAARPREGTTYSWGNEIGKNRANCDGCGSRWDDRQTAPVGSFPANDHGLHDVHGNVWEWVGDVWHKSYAGAPDDGRAWVKGSTSKRVLRGGSWDNEADSMRSAFRIKQSPNSQTYAFGFRVARSLESQSTVSER